MSDSAAFIIAAIFANAYGAPFWARALLDVLAIATTVAMIVKELTE